MKNYLNPPERNPLLDPERVLLVVVPLDLNVPEEEDELPLLLLLQVEPLLEEEVFGTLRNTLVLPLLVGGVA